MTDTRARVDQRCPRCGAVVAKPDVSGEPAIFVPTGKRLAESRFIPRTEFCPNPGWWTSQDADSTEWEVSEMIGGLIRGLQPDVVVETGSAWGQTTKVIGRVLRANGHGHCYSLDPEPIRHAYASWYCHDEVCAGVVTLIPGPSLEYTPPGYIDFLFCDSLYSLRAPELEKFRPWMHDGSFVCVHDTAPGHGQPELYTSDLQGALEAVPGYRNLRLHTPRGITFLTPA